MTEATVIRTESGRFAKGSSGNPAGRPPAATAALRQQLQERGPEVAQVVIDAALSGDLAACRLVLDRIAPPLKATTAPLSVQLPEGGSLSDKAEALINAAAAGQLPTDAAVQMVGAVGALARIVEVSQLEARLSTLETIMRAKQ